MITVKRDADGNLVIEDKTASSRLVLKPYQAVYVMKKLADELGYRVSISKPVIRFKLEALAVKVWLTEGRQTRMFVIPLDVVLTYVSVLRRVKQSASRISKRELTGLVVNELLDKYRNLEKYVTGNGFDWEKFFGSRTDYYVYFHVPVLLLESLGLTKLTSKYVHIPDTLLQVNDEAVKKWLSKK